MKLSTRARYGLRALVELAGHYGQGATNMQEIADKQGLSRKYLDTLFNTLKVAGLVVSRRGAGGGWELTRPPETIRLSEILIPLEGSLGLVQCVDFPNSCSKHDFCNARELYAEIQGAILDVLARYTLADMRNRQCELDHRINGSALEPDLCGQEHEPPTG